ncbi:HNH endonuclease [Shinella zoogloeoides]|uniref:HNH endonuclease n=1 Tax=Shinella zoogloeoides TaxID=352475 RepID=UPI001F59558D|nr:HNH endonuclease [Shinella zoogloeoides]
MANFRLCSITGCGKHHYARGYCSAHWQMWRKHGDPLTKLKAPGNVFCFFDQIVLKHDQDECLIWPYATAGSGYSVITIREKRDYVHRLVCEDEHGPAPSTLHETAHSCGNKRCVARKHLSWKTPYDNEKDKLAHGTRVRGERVGNSRLKEHEVRQILGLKGQKSQAKIAKDFGVSQRLVCDIHRRIAWGWLQT